MSFEDIAAAYAGVEDLARFDERELREYRAELLERSDAQAAFLAPRLPGGHLLEVGCGNGRLLFALAQRGALAGGLGIDLSASRIAFAEAWARDLGIELAFEAGDVLAAELEPGSFDAALCITGAFGYFGAAGVERALLERCASTLRPGGLLCLELYQHPRLLGLARAGGGSVRVWEELPPSDPWRFYLSRASFDPGSSVLEHAKTFIHRETGEVDEGRVERLRIYEPDELRALLGAGGFGGVELYEAWSGEPYAGGEVLVLTAEL